VARSIGSKDGSEIAYCGRSLGATLPIVESVRWHGFTGALERACNVARFMYTIYAGRARCEAVRRVLDSGELAKKLGLMPGQVCFARTQLHENAFSSCEAGGPRLLGFEVGKTLPSRNSVLFLHAVRDWP